MLTVGELIIKNALEKAGAKTVKRLSDEIKAQGHVASGRGINSLKHHVRKTGTDTYEISITGNSYLKPLNDGVPASRIPYTRRKRGEGRGGTSKYIQGLKDWIAVKRPGMADSERTSIAFAIANTHKETGMPSPGSYQYSNTGKRTQFVEVVISSIRLSLPGLISSEIKKAF